MTWGLTIPGQVFLNLGMAYGAQYSFGVLFPAIVGDYFGRLNVASVIGAIFTIAGAAAAFGPIVGGIIYDQTKNYQLAFILGAMTNLFSLLLLFFSRPPIKRFNFSLTNSPFGG